MDQSSLLTRIIEAFRRSHRSVQIVSGLCLLAMIVGLFALFILVAVNPLALGSVVTLITTITGIVASLLRKGPPLPPAPGR